MYRRARNIGLIIKDLEWPRVAGSRKCHTHDPCLKAGVAHATIMHGKHHNHALPTQKMPLVCEIIGGLYYMYVAATPNFWAVVPVARVTLLLLSCFSHVKFPSHAKYL